MDRDLGVLKCMLDEIDYLQCYTKNLDVDAFMSNEDKKRVVSMTLINIGELSRHLSKEFKQANKHIPFKDIIGLRDIAAHGYKSLNFQRIWNTLKVDIPDLKSNIAKLVK